MASSIELLLLPALLVLQGEEDHRVVELLQALRWSQVSLGMSDMEGREVSGRQQLTGNYQTCCLAETSPTLGNSRISETNESQ